MTSKKLIPAMLVLFPVGLIVGGVIAHLFWKYERDQKRVTKNVPFAASLREDISRSALMRHTKALAETIGPRHPGDGEGFDQAAAYLESTLGTANTGYAVEKTSYTVDGIHFPVFELNLPPKGKTRETVLITASYDSKTGSPGADDNATGVAVAISLVKQLAGAEFRRGVRFVFLPCHTRPEKPEMSGAAFYAKRCFNRGDRFVAVLSLDGLGRSYAEADSQRKIPGWDDPIPAEGRFLAAVIHQDYGHLSALLSEAFAAGAGTEAQLLTHQATGALPLWQTSDAAEFHARDYPAIIFTDTKTFRGPEDPALDTISGLNEEFLEANARGLLAIVIRLADPDAKPGL